MFTNVPVVFDGGRFLSFLYKSGVDVLDLICVVDVEPDELNELDLDIVNFVADEPDGMDRLDGFNDELQNYQRRKNI